MNTGQELALSLEVAMARREMRPHEYALVERVYDAAREYQAERNELLSLFATLRRAMTLLYGFLFGTASQMPDTAPALVIALLEEVQRVRQDVEQLYTDMVGQPDSTLPLDQMVNEILLDGEGSEDDEDDGTGDIIIGTFGVRDLPYVYDLDAAAEMLYHQRARLACAAGLTSWADMSLEDLVTAALACNRVGRIA